MRTTVAKLMDYLEALDPDTWVFQRGYDIDREGDFITLDTLLMDMLSESPEFEGDDQSMKQIPTPEDYYAQIKQIPTPKDTYARMGFCSECTHIELNDDTSTMNYTRDYGGDEGQVKRVAAIREGLSKFKRLVWLGEKQPPWPLPCACCGETFSEQVNFFHVHK